MPRGGNDKIITLYSRFPLFSWATENVNHSNISQQGGTDAKQSAFPLQSHQPSGSEAQRLCNPFIIRTVLLRPCHKCILREASHLLLRTLLSSTAASLITAPLSDAKYVPASPWNVPSPYKPEPPAPPCWSCRLLSAPGCAQWRRSRFYHRLQCCCSNSPSRVQSRQSLPLCWTEKGLSSGMSNNEEFFKNWINHNVAIDESFLIMLFFSMAHWTQFATEHQHVIVSLGSDNRADFITTKLIQGLKLKINHATSGTPCRGNRLEKTPPQKNSLKVSSLHCLIAELYWTLN